MQYAIVLGMEDAQVELKSLFTQSKEEDKFFVPTEGFLNEWSVVTDKAELDEKSVLAVWTRQNASFNTEYMKTALKSRAIHLLERARIHFNEQELTRPSGPAFRTLSDHPLSITLKPRTTVRANCDVEPFALALLPITPNVKVLKAGSDRPNGAVQLLGSAPGADPADADEFDVWLCPSFRAPTFGNAGETAFVEPFWLVHRLPMNEEAWSSEPNLELTHIDLTVAEVSRVVVSADGTKKKRASNHTAQVPILTNPEALANGDELVWQDASWVKEPPVKKARPVLLRNV